MLEIGFVGYKAKWKKKKKKDFEQASIKGQKILPTEAENAKSMLRQ